MEKSNKIGILCTTTPKALTTLTILVTPTYSSNSIINTHTQTVHKHTENKQYVLEQASITHSLSLTHYHSLNHSLTHSINHSITHSITHSYTHSITYSITHTYSLTLTLFLSLDDDDQDTHNPEKLESLPKNATARRGRRGAVHLRQHSVVEKKGHRFMKKFFRQPAHCSFCHEMLWYVCAYICVRV